MPHPHYLTPLFAPRSVAVIGASEREKSVGAILFGNLLNSRYTGKVFAVNPRRKAIFGVATAPDIESVGTRVDLAIIATPARTVPEILEQCGRSGVRNAIVVATGFAEAGHSGAALERRMLEIGRTGGVRILGPNCIGIMRPGLGLHAAHTRIAATAGDLALVSQSGAMCSAVLDWAAASGVGFSSVISTGASADVDFGEILDFLIHDEKTRHILLYVEHIRNARRFMSALRSAARVKPVILLKAGRHPPGAGAEPSLADEVFNAAVRRAGVVRVRNVDQLFHAAKALSSGFRPRGRQLAIVTNGGGPGAMAADRAGDLGIALARLAEPTHEALNRLLPRGWAHRGLVDIGGDATPERYREAILAVAGDPNVHSTLVMLAPHPTTEPVDVARAILDVAPRVSQTLCCCWIGSGPVAEARRLLEAAGIPVFPSSETAIELFHNIAKYHRNQKLLVQTAPPTAAQPPSRANSARLMIDALLADGRTTLSAMESKAVLRAFNLPVAQVSLAHNATEALFLAEQTGFPLVMKVDSPDLAAQSATGGVRLNIASAEAVPAAYHDILGAVREHHPDARINGVTLEPYLNRPNGRALNVGAFRDPVFGPVIRFGAGGAEMEIFRDRALALPPLNAFLARDLIDSTRIARALDQFGHFPPVDRSRLEQVLLGVSELVCALPGISELEINPLIIDEHGAIAADARLVIDPALAASGSSGYAHLAIHPYPADLTQTWPLAGKSVTVRPVRPEDAGLEQRFVRELSEQSRFFRFMDALRELPPTLLARFTQIDYDREMALIALVPDEAAGMAQMRQIGNAHYALSPDGESVEFALAVADDWQHCGLGRRLMNLLIQVARQAGYRAMVGEVLTENTRMLRLVDRLGFSVLPHPDNRAARWVVKPLTA